MEWIYIMLGFFAGTIFCFLSMISFIKRTISFAIKEGKKDE